jgi:branched-chain amino acid aminotransferase
MDIYYVDGKFVSADEAVVSVNDLALLRGYGVFDFLRTYNGMPFYMDAHIDRLIHSANQIGLEIPWPPHEIRDIVEQTLLKNSHEESSIRLLVTGGDSPDAMLPVGNSKLIVMVSPLKVLPEECYQSGVKITTTRIMRIFPETKSINYIGGIHALKDAKQKA